MDPPGQGPTTRLKEQVSRSRVEESHSVHHGANTSLRLPPSWSARLRTDCPLLCAAFTSDLGWIPVDISALAALGHQVIAIDLPGYGKTQVSDHKMAGDKAGFMESATFRPEPRLPASGGQPKLSSFVIPHLLVRDQTAAQWAWVPVAPVQHPRAGQCSPDLSLPTMICPGSRTRASWDTGHEMT